MRFLLFFFYLPILAIEPQIDLYCLYTPAFKTMYEDYFLPSIKDNLRVIAKEYPQECPSGIYGSEGWKKTMARKLELMIEAVKEHWNDEPFIFSDVDIVFLQPMVKSALHHLDGHDFVVQQGWPQDDLCAGFFLMRGNERTLRLLNKALEFFREEPFSEQNAIRKALRTLPPEEISWDYLPIESFSNGAYVLKHRHEQKKGRYTMNSEIILDPAIALFHANCCRGFEDKYHFIQRVQDAYGKGLNIEELPECRTRQYPTGPIANIVIFSAPRTGSTLIFNLCRYLFENSESLSVPHYCYDPLRKVFKTHKEQHFDVYDRNTTLFIVPYRNPRDAALSHARIGGQASLPAKKRAKELLRQQVEHFTCAQRKMKEGYHVIVLKYEEFENDLSFLIRKIEEIFALSIDEADQRNILLGYSKENVARTVESLPNFQEFLPLSGFHGNHLNNENSAVSDELRF